ncbi:MAG: S8/S53 family peptidase [Xanthomonadales bacterium]|nr:S8/S53 family peptidase [Xanthomonadales bacterium]
MEVSGHSHTINVYMGLPGWPSYRIGDNRIPFRPLEEVDTIAVCFEYNRPNPRTAKKMVDAIKAKGLKTYTLGAEDDPLVGPKNFMSARGAIWVFKIVDGDRRKAEEDIRVILTGKGYNHGRVGVPLNLTPGQIRVLDSQYAVKFPPGMSGAQIRQLIDGYAELKFKIFGNTRVIRFPDSLIEEHYHKLDQWQINGDVLFGEHDLIAEFIDDSVPPSYHVQDVEGGWQVLKDLNPDIEFGNPEIIVATIDGGFDPAHDKLSGNLSNGTPRIRAHLDITNGNQPNLDHGMGVIGIIAAKHGTGPAKGIAPNTQQIAITRPDLETAMYAKLLRWAGGLLDPADIPADWPEIPGAHIINCSHGVDGKKGYFVMEALTELWNHGILVVYSAGREKNVYPNFETQRPWAAHPKTIAVSNTELDHSTPPTESIEGFSNSGEKIDLCAQGEGVASISNSGTITGTSAAAPMVSATAALMLSANPNLKPRDIRQILRDTADKIGSSSYHRGFSQIYSYGRLNVKAAVKAALEPVKKSVNAICHKPRTQYYEDTETFQVFGTLEGCVNSGGREPM